MFCIKVFKVSDDEPFTDVEIQGSEDSIAKAKEFISAATRNTTHFESGMYL